MIFKQIDEIITGQKTQTRRLVKPGEYTWICGMAILPNHERPIPAYSQICSESGRVRFERFKTYAVCPGRGKPGLWWRQFGDQPHQYAYVLPDKDFGRVDYGYQPLRIKITSLRREQLQDISEADAKAEGITWNSASPDDWPVQSRNTAVAKYAALWNSINKGKGTRWADNPFVYVITFEVVR